MTNAQIIMDNSIALMEAGKIGTTGRTFEMQDMEGNVVTVMEPEPIHTFQHWKQLGFTVKKGEKAVASFDIWKPSKRKADEEEAEDKKTVERGIRMFKKRSHFFSLSQVEQIKA